MKLTLNSPVIDLDDKPIENTKLNKLLAQCLTQSSSGPAIKYLDWAITLYQKGEIEIDASDKEELKKFVEAHPNLTNLVKGQILKALVSCTA